MAEFEPDLDDEIFNLRRQGELLFEVAGASGRDEGVTDLLLLLAIDQWVQASPDPWQARQFAVSLVATMPLGKADPVSPEGEARHAHNMGKMCFGMAEASSSSRAGVLGVLLSFAARWIAYDGRSDSVERLTGLIVDMPSLRAEPSTGAGPGVVN